MGGGLKFEEKKLEKKTQPSPHLRKTTVLCTFHSPQPNNIDPAWQQTRDWGSLLHFSESGRGRWANSYYLLALRLDYMEFAMEATTEWKMGEGAHMPQPLDWEKVHPPQFSEFCLGLGGETAVIFLPDQTTGDFKIPSFASPGHTRSPLCAHPNPNVHIFSSNQGFFYCTDGFWGGSCPLAPPPPGSGTVYDQKI